MKERNIAVQVNPNDNVASIFSETASGDTVEVLTRSGKIEKIQVHENIPYGHKIALRDIGKNDAVTKYGESIGIATTDIKRGDYVHIHNLESARGRGDWRK